MGVSSPKLHTEIDCDTDHDEYGGSDRVSMLFEPLALHLVAGDRCGDREHHKGRERHEREDRENANHCSDPNRAGSKKYGKNGEIGRGCGAEWHENTRDPRWR